MNLIFPSNRWLIFVHLRAPRSTIVHEKTIGNALVCQLWSTDVQWCTRTFARARRHRSGRMPVWVLHLRCMTTILFQGEEPRGRQAGGNDSRGPLFRVLARQLDTHAKTYRLAAHLHMRLGRRLHPQGVVRVPRASLCLRARAVARAYRRPPTLTGHVS